DADSTQSTPISLNRRRPVSIDADFKKRHQPVSQSTLILKKRRRPVSIDADFKKRRRFSLQI
ncbi:hypothetical protein KI387_031753, partial [Taxus chinensis]